MFKDKLGQNIGLGDYVAFPQTGYVRIYHGVVTKFGNTNNVKVNDCYWPSASACIVISKQVIDNKIAQAEILEYKDKITYSRPAGASIKFSVAHCRTLDRLFVVQFHDEREFQRVMDRLTHDLGIPQGDFEFVCRIRPRLSNTHKFQFQIYESYSRKCLSRKSLRELKLEEYIDNLQGIPYSETVFAASRGGSYKPQ